MMKSRVERKEEMQQLKESLMNCSHDNREKKNLNLVSVTDEGGRRRRRGVKEGFHLKPPMSKHGVLTAKR